MTDIELVATPEQAGEIDFARSREIVVGEPSGLEESSKVFWLKLSELDFVSLSDFVCRSLEANGWEANLENILQSLESLRIGRRVQLKGSPGSKKAQGFERVLCFRLPRRGQSGKLLTMLYALVTGSEAAVGRSALELDVNEHPVVKALQERILQLEEALQAQAGSRGLPKVSSEKVRAVADGFAAPPLALSAALGAKTFQVKSLDFTRLVATFRCDGRNYDLAFADLQALPEVGASAVGLLEDSRLLGVLPIGRGWHKIRHVTGRVMAVSKGMAKLSLPGRSEVVVPLMQGVGEDSISPAPKRHDPVVVLMANERALCLSTDHGALERLSSERKHVLKVLEITQLLSIKDDALEPGDVDLPTPVTSGDVASARRQAQDGSASRRRRVG
jgi:hypothetical protein